MTTAKEKDEPMVEKKEEGDAEGGAEANTAVRTDVR